MDNSLDVTSEYFETIDITFLFNKPYPIPLYLCIWHQGKWKPVDYFYNPDSEKILIAPSFEIYNKNSQAGQGKTISSPFFFYKQGTEKIGSTLRLQTIKNTRNRNIDNFPGNEIG